MSLQRRRTVGAVLAAAAIALPLAGCSQDADKAQNAVATGGNFEFITPGGEKVINYEESERKPLRTFSGEDVRDRDKTISLEDYEGEIVVLNSWGQWCAPCRAEADDLQEIHTELQKRNLGTVLGQRLPHAPWNRECDLASVTSLLFEDNQVTDIFYSSPAQEI